MQNAMGSGRQENEPDLIKRGRHTHPFLACLVISVSLWPSDQKCLDAPALDCNGGLFNSEI